MRTKDIEIGGSYQVRIGSRLAPVTVQRSRVRRNVGREQTVFECVTGDTRREIICTAARLRPVPGTALAAAEDARSQAAAARREEARRPRPWRCPEGAVAAWKYAAPVPGMIERVGRLPLIVQPNETDLAGLHRVVDGVHCAATPLAVCRAVRRALSRFIWGSIPVQLRRGAILAALRRHAANRETYRMVMGHDPLPSERMVAAAVGAAVGLPVPR